MNLLRPAAWALLMALATPSLFAQETTRAVRQGVEKGFKTCAAPLNALVAPAHDNDSKYAHLGTWHNAAADQRLFSSVTVEPYSDGVAFGVFSGVKSASGRCDTMMTQVLPIPKTSCTALRETTFKSWKYLQDLGGVPLFEPPNDESTTVFLAPLAGGGCLIIKHAVVYN